MNMNLVSKYLIYLRQSHSYTQETLAEELCISRQAVSKWETGVSLPDSYLLLKLSKLYNITINQILEPHVDTQIKDFEGIISVEPNRLKSILTAFEITDLVKASMGASPSVNELLKIVLPEIHFEKEREAIGSVKIEDVENIHSQIVSFLNLTG